MAVQSKGLEFINVSPEDIEASEKQGEKYLNIGSFDEDYRPEEPNYYQNTNLIYNSILVLAPYSQAVCDMLWFSYQPRKSIPRLDPLLAITRMLYYHLRDNMMVADSKYSPQSRCSADLIEPQCRRFIRPSN